MKKEKSKMKTAATKISPLVFIKTLKPEEQSIAKELLKIFEKVTKKKCVMWGKIFGFGTYEYERSTGEKYEFMSTGFAMRTAGVVIYTIMGHKNYPELLKKLGKYKDAGKSCLYIKKIEDIDVKVLEKLIQTSLKDLAKKYKVI